MLSKAGAFTCYDQYDLVDNKAEPLNVRFICQGKKIIINGILSGPIAFNVKSQWDKVTKSLGALSTLYDAVSSFTQVTTGKVLWQPVMGRKIWSDTEPLSFNLDIEFVATQDAKQEVWLPCQGIMALLHPRNLDKKGVVLTDYAIPGPGLFDSAKGSNGEVKRGNDTKMTGVDGKEIDFKASHSDNIIINKGSFLVFGMCYLTSANITIDNIFDPMGFPLHAKASVSCTTNDSLFVKRDGSFMEEGIAEQSMELGEFGSYFSKVAKALKEGAEKMYTTGKGVGTEAADSLIGKPTGK